MNKGFTLIELLIVIAIIGILAVAFLPSLIGGTSSARDAQRVADLQKIHKTILYYDLQGGGLPTNSGPIRDANTAYGTATWQTAVATLFGGAIPTDPLFGDAGAMQYPSPPFPTTNNSGQGYYYYRGWGASATPYRFVLMARVETFDSANSTCSAAYAGGITAPTNAPASSGEWCYAILQP